MPKWHQTPRVLLPLDAEQQYLRKSPVLLTKSSATTGADQQKARSEPRLSVVTYRVKTGDALSEIANRFGVTTQTLVWANSIPNPDSLKPDTELKVPPTSGVLHTVKSGETLAGIAQKYGVDITDIAGYTPNKLADPNALVLGQDIMVPGAVKPVELTRLAVAVQLAPPSPGPVLPPAPQATGGALLQWPTYGPIYGWFTPGHRGLDISPPYGTPVYAAEAGVVVWVQYINYGYGYHFLIDHGNGFQTLYAHLSEILVEPGERVVRGQHVGRVGTTGRTTGPHLHFEVHAHGRVVDPLGYLPR